MSRSDLHNRAGTTVLGTLAIGSQPAETQRDTNTLNYQVNHHTQPDYRLILLYNLTGLREGE
jgi:hypothetical protein